MSISYTILSIVRKGAYLLLFIAIHLSSHADDRRFKNFSVNDGLADTDVLCLAQDSTGLIWMGTNTGVQSYDGYTFDTHDFYTPGQRIFERHNRIVCMSCSARLLWVGSMSGLTCIDLDTHLYVDYSVDDCEEIRSQAILRLDVDAANRRIWIYTSHRCYVASVDEERRTLSFLKWEIPAEYNNTKGKHSFHEGKMWELGRQHLKCFVVEDNVVKVRRYAYPLQLLQSDDHLDALTVTSAYAYLRTESGCYRTPLLGMERKPDFASSTFVSFHSLHFDIPEKTIDNFFVDERTGDLWCPYWGGLFHISEAFTDRAAVRTYFRNTENVRLSKIKITSILLDRYDNLWVGTSGLGVYFRPLRPLPFHGIAREKFFEKGFYRTEVSAITRHPDGKLWMIMESGSLFCYNETTEELILKPLDVSPDIPYTMQALHISSDGRFLYIGMFEGLLRYEIATARVLWMVGKESLIINQKRDISHIVEDEFGRLWTGSLYSGVYCFEQPGGTPVMTYHISDYTVPALTTGQITGMAVGRHYLLLATTKGLNKLDFSAQGVVERASIYQVDPLLAYPMSSDCLSTVEIENDSTCWLGTIGGGLNRIVIHSSQDNDYTATVYTRQQGMSGNNINIVFADDAGRIWTGGNGIACLNKHTGKVTIYDLQNGLQASTFNHGGGFQASDGTIYMGGSEGMCYFRPQDFGERKDTVNLILSNFYISNKRVFPHDKSILQKTLDKTSYIRLTYDQNDFSISFSALGFQYSDKITYRYRLHGYEDKWNILPYKENRAYYTNVPYGSYRFELQVSTDKGNSWKEPRRTLLISILPPLWLRWWAKLTYALTAFGLLGFVLWQYAKAQRLKRQAHIQELVRKKDEERYQSKMIFFMNISHELKTPLALIMLAVERLGGEKQCKETYLILSNAKKMLKLITEMVDIRRTDLGINELKISEIDMQDITAQIVSEMTCMAADKDITMTYHSTREQLLMDADFDRIGKLMVNICSNAVKYTPCQGYINISLNVGDATQITPFYKDVHREGTLDKTDELCLLTIRDSGVGISAESIHHIFERFFQVKDEKSSHLGSGIGLAIVKNVVLLHGGMIVVSSQRGIGTEIIIALPIRHNDARTQNLQDFEAKNFIDDQYTYFRPDTNVRIKGTAPEAMNPELPILLIVEDNRELLAVLSEHFADRYNVFVATNGREGLELCSSLMPDLIVSDVQMPEMDGIEMCRQIRNNLSVAWMPVILLTAYNEIQNQIEGYESGADLYLPKPFSMELLEVSIRQLLEKKRMIFSYKTQYSLALSDSSDAAFANANTAPESESGQSNRQALLDEEKEAFRRQLHKLIEENIANPDLSVDFCCQQLYMGKTKLWQRIKECCGESLAEYVRNIRLEHAATLLRETTMNISEVKYEVGYTNSSHFTRAFKQKFGISPSDYLKQQDKV